MKWNSILLQHSWQQGLRLNVNTCMWDMFSCNHLFCILRLRVSSFWTWAFFLCFPKCLSDRRGGAAPTPNQERSRGHGVLPDSCDLPTCHERGGALLLCGRTPTWKPPGTRPVHSGGQQDISRFLEPPSGSPQGIQHLFSGHEQCGEGGLPARCAFSLLGEKQNGLKLYK